MTKEARWSKTVGKYGYRVRVFERRAGGRLTLRWWSPAARGSVDRALGHSDRARALREAKHVSLAIRDAEAVVEEATRAAREREAGRKIYFLRSLETGLVKIGSSTDVDRRVRGLSLQGGVQVELLGTIDGSLATEFAIHARLADLRAHGEWFRDDERLRAEFAGGAP